MTQFRFLAVALLATVALTGVASAALYFDVWPATADGSQDTYPDEGYSISGEGNYRFTKSYHHYAYMGFGPTMDPANVDAGKSDGPDKIPQGRQKNNINDSNDGVYMADWLIGKKLLNCAFYWRDADNMLCNPYRADGYYINSPVVITGFRVANDGPFVDRGTGARGTPHLDGNGNPVGPAGFGGCCAGYEAPLLEGGESAPGAWRMGKPYFDRAGVLGYSTNGDINEGDPQHEYYKGSSVDTDAVRKNAIIKVGSGGFGTLGVGGNSTNVPGMSGSSRWAFDYLLQKSDAMMINSGTITEADCTGSSGNLEPRDFAADSTIGKGWYGQTIDRIIIQAMNTPEASGIIECKGLVFSSITAVPIDPTYGPKNTSCFGADQGGGTFGPYLAITATLAGDGPNNDGCVDVVDLLDLVGAFGSSKGDPNWQPGVDWNYDDTIDVVDLLTMVETFGQCIP